jgi:hypothetical protein
MKNKETEIKQVSTILYMAEASESIERTENELEVEDPSAEKIAEVFGNDKKE